MLRIHVHTSATAAKSYYRSGLSRQDYYLEDSPGIWGGKTAEQMGLSGEVDRQNFEALADNLHPQTGTPLTPRTKDNRRVGYDFTFTCPKSLSVLYGQTQDKQLVEAFQAAVQETMIQIETEMKTRVRKKNEQSDRTTGNMVWAGFTHEMARPVDGLPDPHLHQHVFVFNATFDEQEKQYKAGQIGDIKRDASYYEAVYHNLLAGKMMELGYSIERGKKGWEISGISKEALQAFSRRHEEVKAFEERFGIDSAKAGDQTAALTRKGKGDTTYSPEEVKASWQERLPESDRKNLPFLKQQQATQHITAKESAEYAVHHCFERASVVPKKQLVATALKYGVGTVQEEDIHQELIKLGMLTRNTQNDTLATTRSVWQEEQEMLAFAKDGRGTRFSLGASDYIPQQDFLSEEQKQAVKQVLSSFDTVVALEGRAGVGKTTLMKEVVTGIEQTGKQVIPVAPSADASRGLLREEGFAHADTVARLLQDKNMQEKLKNNVLWIDEAGQVSARQMAQIFKVAKAQNARVLMTGDTKQLSAVERGDAFRLIIDKAYLPVKRVEQVVRQKPAGYKKAVYAISKGELDKGMQLLDGMNAIKEVDREQRFVAMASEYVDTVSAGRSALVVSPTHKEAAKITTAIRQQLKEAKKITGKEQEITIQKNLSFTEAQKTDPSNYEQGQCIQLVQNLRGFTRGESLKVLGANQKQLLLSREDGQEVALSLKHSKRFQVYQPEKISIAKGDTIRFTQNGFAKGKKHRLNNGAIYQIGGFTKDGDIKLNNGWIVDKNHANLNLGYCTTAHAAQGKSVDKVLIGQGEDSFGKASSQEGFYVAVSRGKQALSIYTSDKNELLRQVSKTSTRQTATELLDHKTLWKEKRQNMLDRLRRYTNIIKRHTDGWFPNRPSYSR